MPEWFRSLNPGQTLLVKAIPRTSVGKFNKKELWEKYGDMELAKS